jgi:hypothetical protein
VKKNCMGWHPGTASRISTQSSGRQKADGTPEMRKVCLACRQAMNAGRADRVNPIKPYGLVRLNWQPPRLDL